MLSSGSILTLAILLNIMYYVHGLFLGLLQVFFYCCGTNECLVSFFYVLFLAFLVFWRCLFLGDARFGYFGFACFSSFFSCMPVIVGGGRGTRGNCASGGFPMHAFD